MHCGLQQIPKLTSNTFPNLSMFMLYLVNAFRLSITGNLGAYVVSGFEAHSLIPVIGVVSSCMSAASYMCVAKVLNLFDRSYGFAAMVAMSVVGMILSATCTNIAMYCAAEVSRPPKFGFITQRLLIAVWRCHCRSSRPSALPVLFSQSTSSPPTPLPYETEDSPTPTPPRPT
jgi:hypothetical protein